MPSSNPNRAALKRLDRFIASYGDDLLQVPKATQDHLIDLVWDNQSARARSELQEAREAVRTARSRRSRQAARTRLATRIEEAYRATPTLRPVDYERLRRNVARNEDPELPKLVNRFKGDKERLGRELQYRAGIVSKSPFISGAFYHGRSAIA